MSGPTRRVRRAQMKKLLASQQVETGQRSPKLRRVWENFQKRRRKTGEIVRTDR